MGLTYLNYKNVVHRDLKLDNILIHFPGMPASEPVSNDFLRTWDPDVDEIQIVIGDLGFAWKMEDFDTTTSYIGTPLNMAP